MLTRLIARHKISFLVLFIGGVLWWTTGDIRFFWIAGVACIVGIVMFRYPRTILWGLVCAYGALVLPGYGWILVLGVIAILMMIPLFRGLTPVGDFSKPAPR